MYLLIANGLDLLLVPTAGMRADRETTVDRQLVRDLNANAERGLIIVRDEGRASQ